MSEYRGLVFIGDPHLRSRNPSGRIDDYTVVTLQKLEWALRYAKQESLVPCILGDFFEDDCERSLSLIGDLCGLLSAQMVLAIFGNHDTKERTLTDANALMVPVKAGLLRLVSAASPWRGKVGGRDVIVGGSNYSDVIPSRFEPGYDANVTTFWMTHHQVEFGSGDGDLTPFQIDGVDVVINGHLHYPREAIRERKTMWYNPGALARAKRSDHWGPQLLRFDPSAEGFAPSFISVPHAPYLEVFGETPEKFEEEAEVEFEAEFVRGLKALVRKDGPSGEGLAYFLQMNKETMESDVYTEIEVLAQEVLSNVK